MSDKRGRARARRKRRFGYVFERHWPSGRTNYCAQCFDHGRAPTHGATPTAKLRTAD